MPSHDDYNAYLNFVLYAVYGLMGEADSIMRRDGRGVRAVAAHLRRTQPLPKTKTLWRGVLMEPEHLTKRGGSFLLKPDPRLKFTSWSTDKDVACWFARPDTFVSGYVKQCRPRVKGWMLKTTTETDKILWWHKWDPVPTPQGDLPLVFMAGHHPAIQDPSQLEWNLRTQKEVIAEPIRSDVSAIPVEKAGCPSTAKLDAKLTHPGFHP